MKLQTNHNRVLRIAIVASLVALAFLWQLKTHSFTSAQVTKQMQINLDKAIPVTHPELIGDLKPAEFRTPDGKSGWIMKIPGDKPIATPAYSDGKLFIGGGYGSYEFYAINAETGAVVWQIKTSDDGPTAAVVEDDSVAFNTESCTVIVCDARTGKVLDGSLRASLRRGQA